MSGTYGGGVHATWLLLILLSLLLLPSRARGVDGFVAALSTPSDIVVVSVVVVLLDSASTQGPPLTLPECH